MIWLSWRQQRLETAMTATLLALVVVLLVPLGIHMANVYTDSGAAACVAHTAASGAGCGTIVDDFRHRFEHAGPIVPWLSFLPGLFGILFAAPLVLELERGTFRLAWTQSVTRRRWLTVDLVAAAARPPAGTYGAERLRLRRRRPVCVHAVCAVACHRARRFHATTIVATAGGLLGYFALRIGIQTWGRQHYVHAVKAVWRPGTQGPTGLDHAWNMLSGPSDAHGHSPANANHILATCMTGPKHRVERCLSAHHVFNVAVYQPAGRFWLFQGIEAGSSPGSPWCCSLPRSGGSSTGSRKRSGT